MGLITAIKQGVMASAMNKRKKKAPFDLDYSDNYTLPDSAGPELNNSHYFSAHDLSGAESLYWRLGLRGATAKDEVWFVYRSKSGEVYMAETDHFSKGGALPAAVKCVEAGKKFTFSYNGPVRVAKLTESGYLPDEAKPAVHAELNAEFNATGDCFEFSRHMSTKPVARALSKEKFTKAFVADLKDNFQVHYEQQGTVSAGLKIGGKEFKLSSVPALRDHSYGKREWNYFDRYVWIVGLLENGAFFHSSLIRYPVVKELQAGFLKREGETVCLDRVTSMDDIPATGGVPEKFDYEIFLENGEVLSVHAERECAIPFKFGGGGFTINEGISSFTVNGVKGRGITEFGFSADKSRWHR